MLLSFVDRTCKSLVIYYVSISNGKAVNTRLRTASFRSQEGLGSNPWFTECNLAKLLDLDKLQFSQ